MSHFYGPLLPASVDLVASVTDINVADVGFASDSASVFSQVHIPDTSSGQDEISIGSALSLIEPALSIDNVEIISRSILTQTASATESASVLVMLGIPDAMQGFDLVSIVKTSRRSHLDILRPKLKQLLLNRLDTNRL